MDASLPFLAFLGVGDQEMILIMVVVLIFFGGKKMPEFARGMGKALKEFKRATGDVEREFKRVLEEAENPVTMMRDTFKPEGIVPAISPESLFIESHAEASAKTEAPAKVDEPAKEAPKPTAPSPTPPHPFEPHLEGEPEYHSDI